MVDQLSFIKFDLIYSFDNIDFFYFLEFYISISISFASLLLTSCKKFFCKVWRKIKIIWSLLISRIKIKLADVFVLFKMNKVRLGLLRPV